MRGTDEGALEAAQAATVAARDAIAQARAQRDELLVLAGHDIRNAIGIIDSALTMLEESPDCAAAMHGMMRRATHRLGILVRAMVDVDLLQRAVMPLAPVPVRWSALVTPVVDGALAVAATKELAVEPRGVLDAPLACDAPLVERMIAALVDHAVGNAPNGTAVTVQGTRAGAGRFAIRVAYEGRPVGGATLEKYFTTLPLRFCRLAATHHGGGVQAVSPLEHGSGLAFELEIRA